MQITINTVVVQTAAMSIALVNLDGDYSLVTVQVFAKIFSSLACENLGEHAVYSKMVLKTADDTVDSWLLAVSRTVD